MGPAAGISNVLVADIRVVTSFVRTWASKVPPEKEHGGLISRVSGDSPRRPRLRLFQDWLNCRTQTGVPKIISEVPASRV